MYIYFVKIILNNKHYVKIILNNKFYVKKN